MVISVLQLIKKDLSYYHVNYFKFYMVSPNGKKRQPKYWRKKTSILWNNNKSLNIETTLNRLPGKECQHQKRLNPGKTCKNDCLRKHYQKVTVLTNICSSILRGTHIFLKHLVVAQIRDCSDYISAQFITFFP